MKTTQKTQTEKDVSAETKVVAAPAPAKEWANPTPAGLVALAVACACFFALLTGRVEASAMPLVGCWLLGGFAVQLVVALLDLKGGNHAGGNTFLYFSAFFMLVGGMEMILKYKAILAGGPLDARIDGYAWAILTIVLLLWTPAFFRKFSLLSVIVALLDVALPFITLTDLQILDKSWSAVSAWSLLAAGVIAVYLSAATVVNTAFGKKIYPLV
ncbi:MAG: GPR1/FUN34/YaaH family transporter [Oscillospiraceae bacterium]|nr:GPR1/FUN34/YaaH family transporter [Oscillospiraceae bacterium]